MENKGFQNKLYWVYLIGFLLIASLPLWAAPPLLQPAPWGKTILFRIILSILIFFFVYQIVYHKDTSLFRSFESKAIKIILGLLSLLLSLYLLSTIFSPERHFSFWGNPLRGGGFLNFAFYTIFAVLAFLILKERDWKKIWDFSIIIGILATIFGIFQYFKLFPGIIVSLEVGIASTTGASGLFGLYLSFLFFLVLSLCLKEGSKSKKIFYFLSILLFAFGIFISGARAVFLGTVSGLFFFFFFYPKKMLRPKIFAGCFLILIILATYCLNVFPNPPNFIKNNPTSNRIYSYLVLRTSVKTAFVDLTKARLSAWKVGLKAIEDKPILGWGPENFSIGFDKHYDPSLPQIATLWWDRAHNFLIEYAATGGIPFLITYLLLIGVLFWQLQNLKHENSHPMAAHGIQAAFIAYLVANLLGFDGFDSYLIFFLLVGYCLYLISSAQKEHPSEQNNKNTMSPLSSLLYKWRKVIIFFLFIFLMLFIWFGNLKPLFINKELNWADYYSKNKLCQKAVSKMEKVLPSRSIIDQYALLEYSEVLRDCQITNPKQENDFIQRSIWVLEEAAKLRPTYTRTWLLLGGYLNLSVANNPEMKTEEKEELLLRADFCFKKAAELSPARQEIFLGWSDTYILWKKYDEAKEKSEQCIKINDKLGACYWQKALSNILLGESAEYKENMEKANQRQFYMYNSSKYLLQTLKVYLIAIQNLEEIDKEISAEYYQTLAYIYKELAGGYPGNSQYHASLAYVYKILGEYEKAVKEATEVFKLQPENKAEIEKFIKDAIRFDFNNPKIHNFLIYIYTQTGEKEKLREEFLIKKSIYLQLIEKDPENTGYHSALSQVYNALGEGDKAREEAIKAGEVAP